MVIVGRRCWIEQRQLLRLAGIGEDREEGIVVPRRNRIELVVVAAGAADGQAQQPTRDDIDLVVEFLLPRHPKSPPGERQESERRQIARIVARQPIRRQLLQEEPIVGQILVEGPHHPIAIGVGVGEPGLQIAPRVDHPNRVRVARQVEPVASPPFPVMRAGEESIDHLLKGVWRTVGEKGLRLGR